MRPDDTPNQTEQDSRGRGASAPPPQTAAAPPPLLTVEDLAAYLHLSVRGAREVLARGDLPGFRIGKRWYLRPGDLDAAIARKAAEASAPPDAVRILRGVPRARGATRKAGRKP